MSLYLAGKKLYTNFNFYIVNAHVTIFIDLTVYLVSNLRKVLATNYEFHINVIFEDEPQIISIEKASIYMVDFYH